jgi:ABC-type cobalamin/Fe3+-siderophores transport system ATPase subunit
MVAALEIRNLRNITRLRFEIPDPGVWLLTAGNGAGKTTLLTCLRRIGQSSAGHRGRAAIRTSSTS